MLPVPHTPWGSRSAGVSSTEQNSSTGKENFTHFSTNEINNAINSAKQNKRTFGGAILIFIGVLLLLDNLVPRFDFGSYWPLILIAIGVAIIIKATNN